MKNLLYFTISTDKHKFMDYMKDVMHKFLEYIQELPYKFIKLAMVIIIMYLVIKIGNKIIKKFVERQSKARFGLDEKKAKTVGAILKSALKYTVYIVGIIIIFGKMVSAVGVAFASIGGVAIGLAAQNVIKDVINGFFILFEDQFAVGEYIDIDGKSGIVESLELRLTKIRDFNGDLHIIPNGLINKITNHSRGDMRALVEIDVAYEENLDKVFKVLNDICEEFKNENKDIVEGPTIMGVTALKDSGVGIKVVAKAKSMTQWSVENELRKKIKDDFDKHGIEIPYPRVTVKK